MAGESTLTIDGRQVSVPQGTLVLEAARVLGIEIPVLCSHKRLSPLGSCRLCLVEIEGRRALEPACATAALEGMVVRTNTPQVVANRKAMLEFLLTNHPLDCPVCDKGGECELQDLTFKYARGTSRFVEEKHHFEKPLALGALVVLDRERCVLCQRCIRFVNEVAWHPVLTLLERGKASQVASFSQPPFDSKYSGNTIDICPVGALTSRDFRFKARVWELERVPSVCPHCSVGCNTYLEMRRGHIARITPRENEEVNQEWICDKGRFAHHFVNSRERLAQPLVRKKGKLVPASWDEALVAAARRLREIKDAFGPEHLAAIGSVRTTNEEGYLFQKFVRIALGTNNLDHRTDGGWRRLTGSESRGSLPDMERADVILVIGVDPSEEAPVLELRLKRAISRGAKLLLANPRSVELAASAYLWLRHRPGAEEVVLAGFLCALSDGTIKGLERYTLGKVSRLVGVTEGVLREASQILKKAQSLAVVYGSNLLGSSYLLALAGLKEDMKLLPILRGNNALGAMEMGVCPDVYPGYRAVDDGEVRAGFEEVWGCKLPPKPGLDTRGIVKEVARGKVKGLYIMGADPVQEFPDRAAVMRALEKAELLVVQDLFLTETARRAAVVLPAASFAEKEGTFTNLEGRTQGIERALPSPGEARPDWQIICGLAEVMGCRFPYTSVEEIRSEMQEVFGSKGEPSKPEVSLGPPRLEEVPKGYPLALVTGRLLFDGGRMMRDSEILRGLVRRPHVKMNPSDAEGLGEGDVVRVISAKGSVRLPLHIGESVPPGVVFIPCLAEAEFNRLLDMERRQTYVRVQR